MNGGGRFLGPEVVSADPTLALHRICIVRMQKFKFSPASIKHIGQDKIAKIHYPMKLKKHINKGFFFKCLA